MGKAFESTLSVKTGGHQEYSIYFEQSFEHFADILEKDCKISGRKVCIVSDSNVFPLYGSQITEALCGHCMMVSRFVFPA